MITESSITGNNKLIRKSILRTFPSSFAANLTITFALMVDTLLAGALIGQQAIAAVAIGLPAIGIFQALTQSVLNGANIKLAVLAGRSEPEEMNRAYSFGMALTIAFGLFFLAIGFSLAEPLTMLFGGAKNPQVAAQAALYLRASSLCVLMGSLNTFLSKVLALYGHQKHVFRAALIAMIGNVCFSILYIRLLPAGMALAGLGAGTWTGGMLACISSILAIKKEKIPLRFRLRDVHLKSFPEIFRLGFPTSANKLADNVVTGIVNNLIVGAFAGDTMALSIYAAVKNTLGIGATSIMSTTGCSSSLFGILYGSRDKNGLLRALKEAYKIGLVVSLSWGFILYLLLPLFAGFYGMADVPQYRIGVCIGLCFAPLWLANHLIAQVLESTGKSGMSLLYASVPDSILYPSLLALLLPHLGYYGIWIASNVTPIPFMLILYLVRSVIHKSFRTSPERLLFLDDSIRDNVPVFDLSIRSSNTDVTGISQKVHSFLEGQNVSARTAYMTALCLEELAADFVAHTMQSNGKEAERTIMDIKLFSDEDSLRIIIRNVAAPYNPLQFELDDQTFGKVGVKLAQKVAREIDYSYVYRMNIVTILLDK